MQEPVEINLTPPAWLPEWGEAAWLLVAGYPVMKALLIALVGLLLAVMVRALIRSWGLKFAGRSETELDDGLVRLGAGVAAVIIGYLSLMVAVQALPLEEAPTRLLTRLLVTFLVLHLMRAALKASGLALQAISQFQDRFPIVEERTIPLFDLAATVITVGMAAYALFLIWEIDPTAWLASAGVIGIAVGFAARETLANLFAGFFIIADAPYRLGDYVVLDGGERGEITKVGIRSTRLLTRDDVEVIVPNSEMANRKVVNESGGRWVKFRIRLKIGVAYGSDLDEVVELLERVAKEHSSVCKYPEPRVRMRGFGDSSLDFELLCWVDHPSERGKVAHELYLKIYKELSRAGIQIPFPQRDLWIRRMEEELPAAAAGKEEPE